MKFRLIGRGSGKNQGAQNEAGVSTQGEVLVRAFDYSEFNFQTVNLDNTAFNHFEPKTGFRFVIKGAIISGNRDIGANGAVLTIYEASSATSTVVIATPFEIEVPQSTVLPFIIPDVRIAEGSFLNSKSDDSTVRVVLFGYFVPA